MRERKVLVQNSIQKTDNIINFLNKGFTTPKKSKYFFEFALSMAKESWGLTVFANLHSACELVNDYLNTLDTYDRSDDDSGLVKNIKKMELRAKLSQALIQCGPIGMCFNNEKVIGGKYENNNLHQIDKKLISMIFDLRNTILNEKKHDPHINQEQLSQITHLIHGKEYYLARQWSKPGQVSKSLVQEVKPLLASPADYAPAPPQTPSTTAISAIPAPTVLPTQAQGTIKAFNIFFLGTGELLEQDAKAEKKYKHTLLTSFQKETPDSVLVTGIAAGYGDYDKKEDGEYEIKKKRGFFGEMLKETIGGEGHEASIRAAFGDLNKFLETNNIDPNNTDIEINLIGFSRGAVTSIRFANRLRFIYPGLKVNIFAIDPVPGPASTLVDDWEARNIPSNVGEYHVIHMQHVGGHHNRAYTIGFEPEDFTRLTVERPDKLVFSVDILPGLHGGAQIVRSGGMEDPTHITAYNLHQFLRRHGAVVPHKSINLPNEDRVTWSQFDYLAICSDPKERLKKFENMLNNEHLYSEHGSKIRTLNKQMYRYHQNSDYFLTQQHREDFKAVYPNIFYWFFEGGIKDPKESEKRKANVINEIQKLDKKDDIRLIDYLRSKHALPDADNIKIPPHPVGNKHFPEENSPYTNHQTLIENHWVYYHPNNQLLRLRNPVSNDQIAHYIRELDIGSIIEKLQYNLVQFIYVPNPKHLLVASEKKPHSLEHIQHIQLAENLLNELDVLVNSMNNGDINKEKSIKYLMLLLKTTIVQDSNIRSRRGAHHLTQMCWDIIEKNGLQTILDTTLQESIQQRNILAQQQTAPMTTSITPVVTTTSTTTSTNPADENNEEENVIQEQQRKKRSLTESEKETGADLSLSQSSDLFWKRAKKESEKIQKEKTDELEKKLGSGFHE